MLLIGALGLVAVRPNVLCAQRVAPPAWHAPARSPGPAADWGGAARFGRDGTGPSLLRRPWVRPLASLAVPGSGQLLGGQQRGLVYLATELWLVARAVSLSHEGRRARGAFQELAYAVARHPYASVRTDGPFEYYETMGHYVRSGEFDIDPGVSFAPETDSTTYNGSVWLLARQTFFANPDSFPDPTSPAYRAAVDFYSSRAFAGAFRWSWENARLEQDVFRAEISKSDEAFRARTNYLGLVVLNHIVSAVDVLIAQRRHGGSGEAARWVIPRLGVGGRDGALTVAWHAGF